MRILDFGPGQGIPVDRHGSRGLTALSAVRGAGFAVTVLHVAADGELGSHPAPVDQLFLVVAGSGTVCGEDGAWHPIIAGQAALWRAGETHTTRAREPITAVVIEAPTLPVASADGTWPSHSSR